MEINDFLGKFWIIKNWVLGEIVCGVSQIWENEGLLVLPFDTELGRMRENGFGKFVVFI